MKYLTIKDIPSYALSHELDRKDDLAAISLPPTTTFKSIEHQTSKQEEPQKLNLSKSKNWKIKEMGNWILEKSDGSYALDLIQADKR